MSLFLDCLILLRTFKTIIVGLKHIDAEELEEQASGRLIALPSADKAEGVKTA